MRRVRHTHGPQIENRHCTPSIATEAMAPGYQLVSQYIQDYKRQETGYTGLKLIIEYEMVYSVLTLKLFRAKHTLLSTSPKAGDRASTLTCHGVITKRQCRQQCRKTYMHLIVGKYQHQETMSIIVQGAHEQQPPSAFQCSITSKRCVQATLT